MKLLRYIFIFMLLNMGLFANVFLNSSNSFIKGEPFIFEFEVSGSKVEFPEIKKIDGYLVENIGTSKSLQIINGDYKEKIIKRYKILPTDNFTIPSFIFKIDGKEFKTLSKKIISEKVSKTTSDYFDLALVPSKKELFVGEELKVKLIFKYKKGLRITDLSFEQPHFSDFWYKKIDSNNRRYEENGYIVQELNFLLFPQKSGTLSITPLKIDVQLIDEQSQNSFGLLALTPKIVKVYSNDLSFNVKQLPKNVNFIGEFHISASANKTKIKFGEAVSYKLVISGWGNLDDIQDIKLNIPNASIYDNKPELKADFKDDKYQGVFTKVYSIIPNESLEIPSVKFKYYSKQDKKIKEIETKSIKIEVEGQKEQEVLLQKPKIQESIKKEVIIKQSSSLEEKIIFFIFGNLFSLLIFGLFNYVKLRKKSRKETPLIKLVKNSKEKNELIKVLVPYIKKDKALDKLIYECQGEKDFKLLKNEIIKLLNELKF